MTDFSILRVLPFLRDLINLLLRDEQKTQVHANQPVHQQLRQLIGHKQVQIQGQLERRLMFNGLGAAGLEIEQDDLQDDQWEYLDRKLCFQCPSHHFFEFSQQIQMELLLFLAVAEDPPGDLPKAEPLKVIEVAHARQPMAAAEPGPLPDGPHLHMEVVADVGLPQCLELVEEHHVDALDRDQVSKGQH